MTGPVILDTGPWVALHCRDERHHGWATERFARHAGPFVSCEAVVTETCSLLARAGFDPARALALVERGGSASAWCWATRRARCANCSSATTTFLHRWPMPA